MRRRGAGVYSAPLVLEHATLVTHTTDIAELSVAYLRGTPVPGNKADIAPLVGGLNVVRTLRGGHAIFPAT